MYKCVLQYMFCTAVGIIPRQYTRRLIAFCGDHSTNCGCFKPEIQYPKEKLS